MKRTVFRIGEYPDAYIGYTSGRLWNGWATPFFELAEAKRVAEGFNEAAENPMQYDEIYDQFYILDPETADLEVWKGKDYETAEGIKHLYGIGAYSWVWENVGNTSDLLSFACQIEEFIFDYDVYEHRDCFNDREEARESIMNSFLNFEIYAKAIKIFYAEDLSADEKFEKLGGILEI